MVRWLLCFLSAVLLAQDPRSKDVMADVAIKEPWFTGSLLAPNQTIIPKGHVNPSLFFYYYDTGGSYGTDWEFQDTPNLYSFAPEITLYVGVTEWMDFYIYSSFTHQWTEGASNTGFNDLPVGLEFQLYPANKNPYYPGVKVEVQEQFPTGKYDRLDPDLLRTDLCGTGSYATSVGLTFYKIYPLWKNHFISLELNSTYTTYSGANVEGYSRYGNTSGEVSPGNTIEVIFSFEYNFTQKFNFAMDTIYSHNNKTYYNETVLPSSVSVQLAPALEYSFTPDLGIVAGAHFTVTGRNTTKFAGAIAELTYYY